MAGLTSAQRYNKRLDEIWDFARRRGHFDDTNITHKNKRRYWQFPKGEPAPSNYLWDGHGWRKNQQSGSAIAGQRPVRF